MNETWNVAIYLFADDDTTHGVVTGAHAVLTTPTGATLDGWGRAQFSSYDLDVPEVGTELAAARALRQLADRLLQATSEDLDDLEVHEIHLVR
ncbi:dsRBD fold-containing protein [Cellulomonas sp.]|uniref:dsRBD fold-containing protein n=1 Tax=Cellulomonas sp. TaxID=40001 RepID=UPI003BA990B3